MEDWEKILKKLKSLSKSGFWTKQMEEDIIGIINTKNGKINLDFWRKIIMETKEIISEARNCMDFKVEKELITGWILHFYHMKRIKKEDLNKLKNEVIYAPFSIKEEKSGETKSAIISAGIEDLKQDPITCIVEPIVNYYLFFDEHHFYFQDEEDF